MSSSSEDGFDDAVRRRCLERLVHCLRNARSCEGAAAAKTSASTSNRNTMTSIAAASDNRVAGAS